MNHIPSNFQFYGLTNKTYGMGEAQPFKQHSTHTKDI